VAEQILRCSSAPVLTVPIEHAPSIAARSRRGPHGRRRAFQCLRPHEPPGEGGCLRAHHWESTDGPSPSSC
jgi:hypothetical protein